MPWHGTALRSLKPLPLRVHFLKDTKKVVHACVAPPFSEAVDVQISRSLQRYGVYWGGVLP
jgi:hypothetical protein